ncbi:DoxX family protein [Robiginitalea sp. SC105]|uniref:DoxX family protein n=1 Tax=Robiginitalea sp. SC105 TaxID=2762332 RepID=UPI001639B810|nr:DoxX family protein [Robiginitalea sp. SC105]MBC2838167.1 DoxX family protein [Robiginitalea sp. SC105]
MGTIDTWNKWADAHSYYALDVLRVALGVFLFVKGVSFMSNLDMFMSMMRPYEHMPGSWIILHYVAAAHFVGGFFIVIGLLTRWAVAFQFPILFGAIMTNFLGEMIPANLITAVVVLLVCVFFFVYGSGKFSLDSYLNTYQ